jgi:hypothetical protein
MSKTRDQLQLELDAALKVITDLLEKGAEKNQTIKHLEEMLKRAPLPVVRSPKAFDPPSAEQQIAVTQIERLRLASEQRALTLEEAKLFDILVKNKRLADDKSTANISKGTYRDVDDVELMKIVGEAPNPEEDPK